MAFQVPSVREKKAMVKRFVQDFESFSVLDRETTTLRPTICAVCDSIPDCAQWHEFVGVNQAKTWFRRCGLAKDDIADEYPNMDGRSDDLNGIIRHYTTRYAELDNFVLSPNTFVNERNEILICKRCKDELEWKCKGKRGGKEVLSRMPEYAISNNRLVGGAPNCIKRLSEISLSLISIARVYCQSWVFFGGCHQQIKGWHTFYKNRTIENVGNLMQLNDSGMRGSVLVVLCGPFTSTQKAMTLEACSVDPVEVVKALRWLVNNNIKYKDQTIPQVDTIPLPHIVYENL